MYEVCVCARARVCVCWVGLGGVGWDCTDVYMVLYILLKKMGNSMKNL